MVSLIPELWFYVSESDADTILGPNGTWPFHNMNKSEFYQNHILPPLCYMMSLRWCFTVICGMGVIFTGMLLLTLWKKAMKESNQFYQLMLIIAGVDLISCMAGLFNMTLYCKCESTGWESYGGMWVMLVTLFIGHTAPLVSDLLAMVLTLERYLAVGKAQLHKNLSEKYRWAMNLIVTVVVGLISCTRLHYLIQVVVAEDTPGHFVYGPVSALTTTIAYTMVIIGEVVTPFVLVVAMTVLSTMFRVVVMKRQRTKVSTRVNPQPSVPTTNQSSGRQAVTTGLQSRPTQNSQQGSNVAKGSNNNSEHSIIVLTLTLDALFLLNQIGYCLVVGTQLGAASYKIGYESTRGDIGGWITIHNVSTYSVIGCILIECVSHAFNFPLYMCLSRTMRTDFVNAVKNIFK